MEMSVGADPPLVPLTGKMVIVHNTGWRIPLALHVGQIAYLCLDNKSK